MFILILLWEGRIHSIRIKWLDPLVLLSCGAVSLVWEDRWWLFKAEIRLQRELVNLSFISWVVCFPRGHTLEVKVRVWWREPHSLLLEAASTLHHFGWFPGFDPLPLDKGDEEPKTNLFRFKSLSHCAFPVPYVLKTLRLSGDMISTFSHSGTSLDLLGLCLPFFASFKIYVVSEYVVCVCELVQSFLLAPLNSRVPLSPLPRAQGSLSQTSALLHSRAAVPSVTLEWLGLQFLDPKVVSLMP